MTDAVSPRPPILSPGTETAPDGIHSLKGHTEAVWSVGFSPDGQYIVSGSRDFTLKLWSVQTVKRLHTLRGHTDTVLSVCFSPDGQYIASGSSDTTLKLWSVREAKCIHTLEGHTAATRSVVFSPDGQYIVSGSDDKTLKLWSVQGAKYIHTLEGHFTGVNSVCFSPDGQYIVSGSHDCTLKLWSAQETKCIHTLKGHTEAVWSVGFSPDGQYIVSGSEDATLKLWSVREAKCIHTLEGHITGVNSVCFSPDGQYIVSGSDDKTLKLWSVQEAKCIHTLKGHSNAVWSVAFSSDGQYIVSGSYDKTLKLWNAGALELPERQPAGDASALYVNAKVLLVGDSGAGKTGLAFRLTEDRFEATTSTQGAWATHLQLPDASSSADAAPATVEREVWLWDFGGQADYRFIHQLFMDDTALAVLVFDPQKSNAFASISQWERDIARATHRPFAKLLVAGRCDQGKMLVSRTQMDAYYPNKGFADYFETSAQTGEGCKALHRAIFDAIDWDSLPRTTSPRIFKRLKEETIALRDAGRVVLRREDLRRELAQRIPEESFTPDQSDAVLRLLSGPGLVRQLDFGDFVLLRPEWINYYAWAMVRSIRAHPDELGCIFEDDVAKGRLDHQDKERLPEAEETIVLQAMLQTFIQYGLCLREHTPQGPLLIFPAFFRVDRPALPEHPPALVSYRFAGALDAVYASLVVRLTHTEDFEKPQLWRDAADFQTLTGQRIGLELARLNEGIGELSVYCAPSLEMGLKVAFLRFVHDHILAKDPAATRTRHYVCPNCNKPLKDYDAIADLLAEGETEALCIRCKVGVPLVDAIEERFDSDVARQKAIAMETEAKDRLNTETIEQILLSEVTTVANEAGQTFCPEVIPDGDIDGAITFHNAQGEPTNARVYLQLKSVSPYLRYRKSDNTYVFPLPDAHCRRHWLSLPYDVYLVVRQSSGVLQWMNLTAYVKDRKTFPKEIVFAGEDCNRIALLALRNRLVGIQESAVIEFVEKLVPAALDQLLTRLPNASGYVPDEGAKLSRVKALIEYVRSATGPGMAHLTVILEDTFPASFKAPLL